MASYGVYRLGDYRLLDHPDGFVNLGYGLPVINFMRNGSKLNQVPATSVTSTTVIVPFLSQNLAGFGTLPGQRWIGINRDV